ncbi:hypothetical protein ACPA9J_16205 [Pseudomonas aeruginosa]
MVATERTGRSALYEGCRPYPTLPSHSRKYLHNWSRNRTPSSH